MLRRFFSFTMITLLLAAQAPPASAHTMLERSWPRAEEVATPAPTSLRLRFTERIEPALARVTLTSARGTNVGLGPLALEAGNRRTIAVPIAGALAAEEYEVFWRVVSADGHPSEGRYRFSVAP